ncbi:MAG: ThuA domain-containing protein [Chthoniobacteraceae bacterium]
MSERTRVTVWGENVQEHTQPEVGSVYPEGMHECIAAGLRGAAGLEVGCATLQQPGQGLPAEVLARTDVLLWWGHKAHAEVLDETVERVIARVWEGMGLIVLHSGHFSKPFKRLMGTNCSLVWRVADEKERVWNCNPGHAITRGLPPYFEVPQSEMYGEPFAIPAPDEQIFISWYEGGEVFRSGCTWRRGNGKIFYFSPGHEIYPIYRNEHVVQVLRNAVEWARPEGRWESACVRIPAEEAAESKRLLEKRAGS